MHEQSRATTIGTMRPLLLLDVDGVLSPTGGAVPRGFELRSTPTYSVVIRPDHREWLRTLSEEFELVWASTWGDAANRVYGEIHGIGALPVIPLEDLHEPARASSQLSIATSVIDRSRGSMTSYTTMHRLGLAFGQHERCSSARALPSD